MIGRLLLSLAVLLACPGIALADLPARIHAQGEFSFATGPVPGFVVGREVPAVWPQKQGEQAGNWRNWLVDSQLDRSQGKVLAYSDRVSEPLTPELLGQAARYEIEFNPLYQRLMLHRVEVRRAGAWSNRFDATQVSLARRESGFESNLTDGSVTALLHLSDVRVGDLVRVSYSIEGENPVIADSEADLFYLAWTDPILERHVRLLFPAKARIDVRRLGTDAKVERRSNGAVQEVETSLRQIPAIADEGSYPNWYQRFPLLQVAPARSWGEVVAWALPLYPPVSTLPAELQSKVAEWSGIADPHARAFAVLRTIQREVRYFGIEMGDSTHRPTSPATTWQRRYGDCKDKAYLVATLLRALGIEAEPALVSTEWGRAISTQLPAAADFNHVIVHARIDGASYWLDPTLSEQRGDLRTLDVNDYGFALPIASGSDALVPVQPPPGIDNGVSVIESYTPAEDGGKVDLRIDSTYTGIRAQDMRVQLDAQGLDSIERNYANFYRKRFSELSPVEPMRVEDSAESGRLVLREHYTLDNPWAVRSGTDRSLDVFPDALNPDAQLPATPERSGPLSLSHPATLRHRIVVALPKGWNAGDLPGKADVTAPQFQYRRSASKGQDRLELEHEFKVLADHVPADAVRQYVRDLREVGDELDVRINLQMAVPRAEAERTQRLQRLLRDAMDKKKEQSR